MTLSGYDEIPSDCAMWFPEYLLGKKWVMRILMELVEAPKYPSNSMSYTDINELIPEISSRTLSRRLTEMINTNMIILHENEEHPTKVRYSLSKAGSDLIPILAAVRRWSLKHGNCDNDECINDNCRHSIQVHRYITNNDIERYDVIL